MFSIGFAGVMLIVLLMLCDWKFVVMYVALIVYVPVFSGVLILSIAFPFSRVIFSFMSAIWKLI